MSVYVVEVFKTKPINSKKDQFDSSFFLGYYCKKATRFKVTEDITEAIKYFKIDSANEDVSTLNDFTFIKVGRKFTSVKARIKELN